jgi:hypothetical protein
MPTTTGKCLSTQSIQVDTLRSDRFLTLTRGCSQGRIHSILQAGNGDGVVPECSRLHARCLSRSVIGSVRNATSSSSTTVAGREQGRYDSPAPIRCVAPIGNHWPLPLVPAGACRDDSPCTVSGPFSDFLSCPIACRDDSCA